MGDEESDNDLAGSVVNQSLNRSTLGLVTHDKSLEATEKKQTQQQQQRQKKQLATPPKEMK